MASFTRLKELYSGGVNPKEFMTIRGTLVLSGEGAAVGDIPASLFGLSNILDCGLAVKSDNTKLEVLAPDATGSSLLAVSLTQATDANRNSAADLTGTYIITVTGD